MHLLRVNYTYGFKNNPLATASKSKILGLNLTSSADLTLWQLQDIERKQRDLISMGWKTLLLRWSLSPNLSIKCSPYKNPSQLVCVSWPENPTIHKLQGPKVAKTISKKEQGSWEAHTPDFKACRNQPGRLTGTKVGTQAKGIEQGAREAAGPPGPQAAPLPRETRLPATAAAASLPAI